MDKFFKSLPGSSSLLPLLIVTIFLVTSGCEGCGMKKSRSSNTAIEQPAGDDGDLPDDETNDDVGEDVPPIDTDTVSSIDTTNGAAIKHLVFNASGTMEAGRYLSEFLMVIRASEDSCVRLKVRPTAGLTQEVKDEIIKDGIVEEGACKGQKFVSEATKPAAATKTRPTLGLADGSESGFDSARVARTPVYDWLVDGSPDAQNGFNLMTAAPAVCATRLFRMQKGPSDYVGTAQGLENVQTKTGRLQVIGSKVRIWLDEEYANVCSGGGGLNSRTPLAFAPLVQLGAISPSVKDLLFSEQLQNLADEMDRIVAGMSKTYGSVSDIDSSGYIEVFLSPNVNRSQFNAYDSHNIDDFRARPIFKPQDLALYNSESNPLSNEGEVLYLWTPDPGGIFNYVQFPSGNSVSSNYAKGYLTSQLMNLVIANSKLFTQKLPAMEDSWLAESLAGLASAYYAGNDFTVVPLAQYLTSRPQYISVTSALDTDLISKPYLGMASEEQFGLHTLFGWYLHSRLCGKVVTPCAALKTLLDSKLVGTKNVEALLNEPFKKTLENFGLSLGVELTDHPDETRKLWDKKPLADTAPPAPYAFPNLTPVTEAGVRQTQEADQAASAILNTADTDQSTAGPLPSRKMLIYQAIAPDNDMEFKLTQDSVAYILVTGLIESQTDMTAVFGKGLNVVFVPVGDRDSSMRRLHLEKVSEQAHSDLRPENLTSQQDADTTYAYEQTYPTIDYSVTQEREIWALGSIDNYTLNVVGSSRIIGDSDAYNLEFKPCDGKSGSAKTTCEAQTHHALVQVHVRDFAKELAPMLIATAPDRRIFRGKSVFGRLNEVTTTTTNTDVTGLGAVFKKTDPVNRYTVTFSDGVPGMIALASHPFVNGDVVQFSAVNQALPDGIVPGVDYVVVVQTSNLFYVTRNSVAQGIQNFGKMKPYICQSENAWQKATVTFNNENAGGLANTVSYTAHGFLDGQLIRFGGDYAATTGMPRGIKAEAQYKVVAIDANTFSLLDIADQPVNIGQSGNIFYYANGSTTAVSATMSLAAQAVVTVTGAAPANDSPIVFWSTGDLPYGVIAGKTYYVTASSGSTFKFSTATGGSGIVATDTDPPGPFYVYLGEIDRCSNGNVAGAYFFDHNNTKADPTGYAHSYDNYLMMGLFDFPYTNMNMISYKDMPNCDGFRCFLGIESDKQNFTFKLSKEIKPERKALYATARNLNITGATPLSADAISTLADIKNRIDHCAVPDPQPEAFVTSCIGTANLSDSECRFLCGPNGADAQQQILNYFFDNKFTIRCPTPGTCTDAISLIQPGNYTSAWLEMDHFFWYQATGVSDYSYYRVIEPTTRNDYCGGEPGSNTKQLIACPVREDTVGPVTDIREQLNVPFSMLSQADCYGKEIGVDFEACIDAISYQREITPDHAYLYAFWDFVMPADRTRQRYMPIAARAGEVIGKPERLQWVTFDVPGTGGIANIIIGGRSQSQGKYLLRARILGD